MLPWVTLLQFCATSCKYLFLVLNKKDSSQKIIKLHKRSIDLKEKDLFLRFYCRIKFENKEREIL